MNCLEDTDELILLISSQTLKGSIWHMEFLCLQISSSPFHNELLIMESFLLPFDRNSIIQTRISCVFLEKHVL